jgi:hypothetical protein
VCTKPREFNVRELVYARNYSPGPRWLPGEIVEKQGSTLYLVLLTDGRRVRKHADQLITRAKPAKTAHAEGNESTGLEECDPVEYPIVVVPTETVSNPGTGDQTLSPDPAPELDVDLTSSSADNTGAETENFEPLEVRRSSRARQPPTRYGDYRTH